MLLLLKLGFQEQVLSPCTALSPQYPVCVCVQLVMRTKPGALEERICPWARYVTRPKDDPIFEQTFWDPPQEQVCWSRCFAEPVCCLPVISYQRSC